MECGGDGSAPSTGRVADRRMFSWLRHVQRCGAWPGLRTIVTRSKRRLALPHNFTEEMTEAITVLYSKQNVARHVGPGLMGDGGAAPRASSVVQSSSSGVVYRKAATEHLWPSLKAEPEERGPVSPAPPGFDAVPLTPLEQYCTTVSGERREGGSGQTYSRNCGGEKGCLHSFLGLIACWWWWCVSSAARIAGAHPAAGARPAACAGRAGRAHGAQPGGSVGVSFRSGGGARVPAT